MKYLLGVVHRILKGIWFAILFVGGIIFAVGYLIFVDTEPKMSK